MGRFYHYKLDYCEIFVLENVLVKQIEEGEIISADHVDELIRIIDKHFKDKPVVYLSNRTFSYSVDPLVYKEASKIKQLIGIGIIVSEEQNVNTAHFEGKFYDRDFNVFRNFDDAMIWSNSLLQKNR
ncbi:hypothetical protein [Aquimarina brevivitae]|uniref:SpoIIAA-like protein n=1 Tax=Aquimarina brevivitae TaxID=323412 RepID=A0A4Q7NUJ7_9FLAO|nr:hypothetical protein [Aquimarina brevivitae]RZS90528.1 hypothetical protein EV197_3322 [Aquimarina brevivitae]